MAETTAGLRTAFESWKRRLVFICAATMTLASASLTLTGTAQSAPNTVRIEPAASIVAPQGSVDASLVAEAPASGLGAWVIDVIYDASLLTATDCVSHAEGACTINVATGAVQSAGHPLETLTGQLKLASITFQATGPAGECSPLVVQVVSFIDPEDVATTPLASDGEICIQDTAASTPTPAPEPTPVPTPTPEAEPPCARYTDYDPGNFSDPTNIDNQWFPLVPGRKLVLTGVSSGHQRRVVLITTDLTKVVNGVRTVVQWGRDYRAGALTGATLAFFAQDDDGNVWQLGEYPEEYEGGEFTGAPSTWIAGSASAEAGIHMLAEPNVGGSEYLQGWAPEIDLLDCAKVIATGGQVCVPLQCYEDSLVTEERSAIDVAAGRQRKSHALNTGVVEVTSVEDPAGESIQLTKDVGLSESELAWAQQEALKLEERAYQVSDVYADTPPAEPRDTSANPTPSPSPAAPAATLTAALRPIPTVLAIAQPPARSARPRLLPSAGGLPVNRWSALALATTVGMGAGLAFVVARGYLRWGAAADPDVLEDFEGETVALSRIANMSRMRREAQRSDERPDWTFDFNRETPPKGKDRQ